MASVSDGVPIVVAERATSPAVDGLAEVTVRDPIDANAVLLVRGTILGLGVLAATRVARHIRLVRLRCSQSQRHFQFTRFRHNAAIPDEFIRHNYRLRGKLAQVERNGDLMVRHAPVVRLPFTQQRPKRVQDEVKVNKPSIKYAIFQLDRTTDCLAIRLAGVNLIEPGQKYLHKVYGAYKTEPDIWFTLIKRGEDRLECDVFMKKVVRAHLKWSLT